MRTISLIYAYIICFFSSKRQSIIIEHTLNRWVWPFKCLGGYYNSLPNFDINKINPNKYEFLRGLNVYLDSKSTEYERLHYHNVEHLKWMTDNEFFVWYCTEYKIPMSDAEKKILKHLAEQK